MCVQFIAFYITKFETVFHGLIFWAFLFIPPIAPVIKIPAKYNCFTVSIQIVNWFQVAVLVERQMLVIVFSS